MTFSKKEDLLRLCGDHLRLISENMYLPHCQICFLPQDLDFAKFQHYPQSSYNPKLLSRRAYLQREEYKDDLKRLDALHQAVAIFKSSQDIYLNLPDNNLEENFLLPQLFTFGEKLKVPAGEKIIFLGYPEGKTSEMSGDLLSPGEYPDIIPNSVCLFPGKIKSTPEGNIYSSYSLDEVTTLLDKKSNYAVEAPILNISKKETLDSLKQKLVAYLRMKVKWSLYHKQGSSDQVNPCLYQLSQGEDLPLEKIIDKIYQGNIGPEESLFFREFPLIFSSLNEEVTLYINEEKAIIEEAKKYLEAEDTKFVILNPVLASEKRDEKYSIPISVEMRALHINYAYQLTSQDNVDTQSKEPLYEDFLGEANWIIAPVILHKSNGLLHGHVEAPPYLFEDFLIPPSPQDEGEEEIVEDEEENIKEIPKITPRKK